MRKLLPIILICTLLFNTISYSATETSDLEKPVENNSIEEMTEEAAEAVTEELTYEETTLEETTLEATTQEIANIAEITEANTEASAEIETTALSDSIETEIAAEAVDEVEVVEEITSTDDIYENVIGDVVSTNIYNSNSSDYDGAVSAFTNDSRWKDGAAYSKSRKPYISTWSCIGCMAYAADFTKYVYGIDNPRNGTAFYNTSEIRNGDVIYSPAQSGKSQHYFVVLYRSGNTLTVAEAASNRVYITTSHYSISGNSIYFAWDGKINRSFTGYHYGAVNPSNTQPDGRLDAAVSDSPNTIFVSGWAYDPDVWGAQLTIHIYVGGEAGTGAPCYVMTANTYRPDVNEAYPGIGDYHGYQGTITVSPTGTQPVYVYALDTAGGVNPLIGSATVNIASDTIPPTISNVSITQSSTQIFVNCNVSDESGIDHLMFPAWLWNDPDDTQETLYWGDWVYPDADGNVSYTINISDHNNATNRTYRIDIIAYDKIGNAATERLIYFMDTEPPVISNVSITQSSTQIFVSCNVSDASGIDHLIFPTWLWNDPDDAQETLYWGDWVYPDADGNVSYTINISDHNNATNRTYRIDIIAYDKIGNAATERLVYFMDTESPVANITDKIKLELMGGSAISGGYVDMPVKISNNNGIATYTIGITYDNSVMYPVSYTKGKGFADMISTLDAGLDMSQVNKIIFTGDSVSNISGDYSLFTVRFKIKDNVKLGSYPLGLNQADTSFATEKLDNVDYDAVINDINVVNALKGDVSNDGIVNGKDVVLLRQYVAGFPSARLSENQISAGDVTGDAIANGKDIVKIRQYIAGFPGITLQ